MRSRDNPCPSTDSATQKTGITSQGVSKKRRVGAVNIACGYACAGREKPPSLTRSEWTHATLSVHHSNFTPEDNTKENLIALCTPCHLAVHGRTKRSNTSPGQLSLWDIAPNVFAPRQLSLWDTAPNVFGKV